MKKVNQRQVVKLKSPTAHPPSSTFAAFQLWLHGYQHPSPAGLVTGKGNLTEGLVFVRHRNSSSSASLGWGGWEHWLARRFQQLILSDRFPTRETFPSTHPCFARPTHTPSDWNRIYWYRWQSNTFEVFWTRKNSCGKHWISADMSLSAKWSRDGQVSLTMQWVWGFLMLVQPPPMTIDLETLSK